VSADWTLDLLRHGEAEKSNPKGDLARALTAQGRADLERLAAALAADGARHDRVFASPIARAKDSAALALSGRPDTRIETLEALLPDREPDDVIEALETLGAVGHVMLVGHQPLLGRLCAWLTGGEQRFAPASLVRVRCEAGAHPPIGRVEWTWHAAESRG
jgi:phosphohistidine phosphatase